MIRNILPILFTVMLFSSCTKKLNEVERSWNPYHLNQTIVFESSEKELDTIVIDEIIDAVSSSPEPELYRHMVLKVYGKRLKKKESKFSNVEILNISSSTPNKTSQIGFPLNFKSAWFAGWGFKLNELSGRSTISVTTKAGTFDDVIKLQAVVDNPEKENEVKFMYWSKSNGYIKFERDDGFTWELVSK